MHRDFSNLSSIFRENKTAKCRNMKISKYNFNMPLTKKYSSKKVDGSERPEPICKIKSSDDLAYSVEKYSDQVGDGISFDKGQRFSVK